MVLGKPTREGESPVNERKVEKDPGRGVKENLKPCVYKLWNNY